MAVQTDGFQGIIQGILQGHQIATQLRNQAMHEEAFQRQKESQDREAQLQDIETQIKMNRMGARPVENGMVSTGNGDASAIQRSMNEQPAADAQSPLDQLQGLPTQQSRIMPGTTYRKPIGGQTIQFKDRAGNKQSWELPSADEQRQSAINDKVNEETSLETARLNTAAENQRVQRKNELALTPGGGIKAPAGLESQGWNAGDLMTRRELSDATAKAEAARNANQIVIPKEGTLVDRSGATPKTLATGVPKDLNPEEQYIETSAGTFKNADGSPKTRAQLTQPELGKILGQYKQATADPEIRQATLASKAASQATADLAQTMKQIAIGQAPTKEDATRIADHILNHELAPSQISEIRGRGNGALGMMIEREMAKKDPHFSWQQADSDYAYSKSPALQNTVRYMDTALGSMQRLQSAADTLANGKIRSINGLMKLGKNQFNNIDLKRFQTDVTLVGDEIGKIMQGGGTGSGVSDGKLKQAQEIFKDTDSPDAIRTALQEVQSIIGYRRRAVTRGTFLENAPVPEPSAATAGYQQGHVYGGMEFVGGDPNSAASWKKAAR